MKEDIWESYLAEVRQVAPLPFVEQDRLLDEYQLCSDARKKEIESIMVKTNARMVIAAALKYDKKGEQLMDLVQAGSIGILTAVRSFRPGRGTLYSYIEIHIKRELIDFLKINGSYGMCYPRGCVRDIKKIKALPNFELMSHESIASELGLSTARVAKMLEYINRSFASFDQPINTENNDGVGLISNIIPDNDPTPEKILLEKEKLETLKAILNCLSPAQKKAIQQQYFDATTDGSRQNRTILVHLAISKINLLPNNILDILK